MGGQGGIIPGLDFGSIFSNPGLSPVQVLALNALNDAAPESIRPFLPATGSQGAFGEPAPPLIPQGAPIFGGAKGAK